MLLINSPKLIINLAKYSEKMMNFLESWKNQVEEGLATIDLPDRPKDLYDPIRYMLALGGKRIRPILVLMGAEVFDPAKKEAALSSALSIELFHNFTLIHDDIMDRASLRRGKPTVHTRWSNNVAVLAGDNLLILAYQHLAKSPSSCLGGLLTVFNKMAQEVCEGQQLDMDYEKLEMISSDEYLEMIRLKTSVLLGAALKMGALIGGASAEKARLIYDFGVYIGLAFQIQDDILDVYGDAAKVGKKVGGDILANKKTFLFIRAFESGNPAQKAALLNWFSESDSGARADAKIKGVMELYDQLGVRESASEKMEFFIGKAFACLESLDLEVERLGNLRRLAQILLIREK